MGEFLISGGILLLIFASAAAGAGAGENYVCQTQCVQASHDDGKWNPDHKLCECSDLVTLPGVVSETSK